LRPDLEAQRGQSRYRDICQNHKSHGSPPFSLPRAIPVLGECPRRILVNDLNDPARCLRALVGDGVAVIRSYTIFGRHALGIGVGGLASYRHMTQRHCARSGCNGAVALILAASRSMGPSALVLKISSNCSRGTAPVAKSAFRAPPPPAAGFRFVAIDSPARNEPGRGFRPKLCALCARWGRLCGAPIWTAKLV
jgi:hypothetical protein